MALFLTLRQAQNPCCSELCIEFDSLQIVSVRQVQEVFAQFKNLVK